MAKQRNTDLHHAPRRAYGSPTVGEISPLQVNERYRLNCFSHALN